MTESPSNSPTRTDLARPDHAVIVGCGRVGSNLATRFVAEGYTVAVIDIDSTSFRRLGDIDAERHLGVGYDRATMERAGVDRACAVAAVTNGDNSNIVVARTAKEHFRVPRVIARIYDARRAAIYERLGIATVASAALTSDLAARRLLPETDNVQWVEPSATVSLVERPVPNNLVGKAVGEAEAQGSFRIAVVSRLGAGIVPTSDLVLQEGDLFFCAVRNEQLDSDDSWLTVAKGSF